MSNDDTATLAKADAAARPPLTLSIVTSPDGESEASVPVRWHVSEELVQKLRTQQFENPHILIRVSSVRPNAEVPDQNDYDTTAVYIVPLTREMQYVRFSRSGVNQVSATVINLTSDNFSTLN